MEANRDIKIETLLSSHPYTSQLCAKDEEYKILCGDLEVLRNLMRKWLFPSMNIPKDYPVLSYKTIAEYALFYYPISESKGKFHPLSLYYRASLVYDEAACRPFFEDAISHAFEIGGRGKTQLETLCLIASAADHCKLLEYIYDRFITTINDGELDKTRKLTCVIAALFLEDRDKFNVAFSYYNDLVEGNFDLSDLYADVSGAYIPDYDLRKYYRYLRNILEWTNRSYDLDEYDRAYESGVENDSEFGYDAAILSMIIKGKPIPSGTLSTTLYADHFTLENMEPDNLNTATLLQLRPDLLSSDEFKSLSKLIYNNTEQFYYYFIYGSTVSWKISYSEPNHLSVYGYGPDLVKLAKKDNILPEEYV